jgi:tetratricopeptide (TPR) repeat protein
MKFAGFIASCLFFSGMARGANLAQLDEPLLSLRKAGWDAAYGTDYATAREKFSELQRRAPAHPVGDLSMASVVWQEYLFVKRRMTSNVYSKDSKFYSGASKTKEGAEGDEVDRQVDGAFQENLGRAMTKAQAMVDAAPKNAEALYFLGSVYGVRAAYELSAQRKFWAALKDGMRSVKLHEKVIELDPGYVDAYLTLGTYHYGVGCIPQPFRMLVSLTGIRGGKQKGITELETVVAKGNFNRDDARVILVALYRYEGQLEKALEVLKANSARYPQNPLLRIEMASTLAQMRRPAEAAAIFDELLRGADQRVRDLVLYQYGEALALEKDYKRAAERFAAVEKAPGAEPALMAQAMTRAAEMRAKAP